MSAYDEHPRYESDGDGIDWHPVAYGPQYMWDIRWHDENSTDVVWFAYGDNYRAKFGHWNGDDETVPFWKVEIHDRDGNPDEWVRCSDMENKLLAFTTKEGLHKYLRSELD